MSVVNQLTGSHDGSLLGIQRNATPGQMEIRLNLPFDCLSKDVGIPIGAISPFSLRVRIYLTKMSSLIESFSGALQPNVFGQQMTVQTTAGGSPLGFVTKNRVELGKPQLQLRVQYVYVDAVCQKLLRDNPWTVPFQRCILNQYTLEDYIWKAGSTPTLRKLLEVFGSIQRLRVLFQTEASYLAGQAWNYTPAGGGSWFSTLTFFIHGQDRLGVWDPDFFEKVTPYCHDNGQYVPNVYCLDAGAEDLELPAGTLNLTQAEKPELQFVLTSQVADTRNGSKKTYLRVYADVWDLVVLTNQVLKLPYS